ncbi:fimbrial protein [Enterobacter asburiae]|uniref:fimbrial protein n=1 Tax=Scandinavium sp. UTDF21-P1B TaxID=3446379 RepID=UPI00346CFBB7
MKQIKTKLGLLTVLLSCCCGAAWGYEQGEVRLDNGTQTVDVDLTGDEFPNNRPGAKVDKGWKYTPVFDATAYCPDGPIGQSSIYYKAESTLASTPDSEGYYKLNDYISARIEIYIDGHYADFKGIPFFDVDNKDYDYQCVSNSESLGKKLGSVSEGKVTFRLDKSLTNGVTLDDLSIFNIFGRLSAGGGSYGSEPLFHVNLRSAVIGVPEKCEFNDGQPIRVDFGDIGTSDLDGSAYQKPLDINFVCSGGIFDDDTTPPPVILLSLQGASSSFDNRYFKTSQPGLGIVVKSSDGGEIVEPRQEYQVSSQDNKGSWRLVAAPIADHVVELEEGEFTASATVIASVQ